MTSLRYVALAGLGVVLAACTITTGPGDDRDEGRRPWGSGGSGGQGSDDSDAGAGGEGGSGGNADDGGSGGSGGENPGDGGQCIQSPTAGECEKCAFTECEVQVCDCKADPDCAEALAATAFFDCLEEAGGDPTETANCDIALLSVTETEEGADLANDLGTCLHYGTDESAGCPLECGT